MSLVNLFMPILGSKYLMAKEIDLIFFNSGQLQVQMGLSLFFISIEKLYKDGCKPIYIDIFHNRQC